MYTPVKGSRISSKYLGGFRSSGGHSGIDFAAPSGSRAYAVVGGTVISAGNGGAYGNLVKVRHDDGSIGYYAHLSRFGVKRGQRVDRGSTIGFVGSTGNSTGPHLHFEVRQDGSPVDPSPWLEGGGGKRVGGGLKASASAHGGDQHIQMPDVVQYHNPEDILGSLTAQAQGAAPTGPAGGFATPALDDVQARNQRLPYTSIFEDRDPPQPLVHYGPVNQGPQMEPISHAQGSASMGGGAQGDFAKLMGAIKAKESGGSYSARNRHSGALGAYQIMPSNIASWSKAALGHSITTSQFLNNPALQDKIARHRMGMYFKKYGAAGAALAWYAGEGALNYSNSAKNRSQGQYPSMNDYVKDILRRAGL